MLKSQHLYIELSASFRIPVNTQLLFSEKLYYNEDAQNLDLNTSD